MDLKETRVLGDQVDQHWYYRAKSLAVKKILRPYQANNILDVGAGSGYFSEQLLLSTDVQSSVCVDTGYTSISHKMVGDKRIDFLPSCDKSEADCVLMMDVIEHVEDDVGLIKEYVDKVPVGTNFLISVPAFNFMWSPHDVYLEHFRRYSLPQLKESVQQANLEIINSSYYYGLVFPIAFAQRMLGKLTSSKTGQPESSLQQHGKITNSILFNLCKLESGFFQSNRLAGLTVFCLAKKV